MCLIGSVCIFLRDCVCMCLFDTKTGVYVSNCVCVRTFLCLCLFVHVRTI